MPLPVGRDADPPELEALRHEVGALRAQLDADRQGRSRRARQATAWVVAVLAIVATTLSLTMLWSYRTLNNTDLFVARVGPIIEQPAVVAEVSTAVSDAIVDGLGIEQRVAEALPEGASVLAAPVTSAARSYLAKAVTDLMGTEQFQAAWTQSLAVSHDIAIRALKGVETPGVTVADGAVVVNVVPLVNATLEATSTFVSQLLGRDITLPTVTEQNLAQAVAALEQQFGVQLPDTFGQVTLFSSDQLAVAQDAYRAATVAAWLAPLVALVLVALAVAIAVRRLRMLLSIVVGTAVGVGVVGLALQPLETTIVAGVQDEGLAGAVAGGFSTLLESLTQAIVVVLVLGVLAALALLLTGGTRSAVAARRAAGEVPGLAARHRTPFLVGGVVLALLVLALIPGRSWAQLGIVLLMLAAYVLAVLLAPRGDVEPAGVEAAAA